MKQLDRITENIATGLLVIVGFAGLAITIADFVGWEPPFLSQKVPLLLILLTVALLASAIGLERVGRFRRHDKQLERFESLMARSLGGQHLVRYNEVYDSMIRHVGTLHKRLRTMAVGRSITSPDEWAKTVARRLQETKRAGAPACHALLNRHAIGEVQERTPDEKALPGFSWVAAIGASGQSPEARAVDCDREYKSQL